MRPPLRFPSFPTPRGRSAALLLPLVLGACATLSPRSTAITIDTAAEGKALAGAACSVSTNSGSWNIVTPSTLDVGNASGPLKIECSKAGFRDSQVIFKPDYGHALGVSFNTGNGWGSLVGISFATDASGSVVYPSRVTVQMVDKPRASP